MEVRSRVTMGRYVRKLYVNGHWHTVFPRTSYNALIWRALYEVPWSPRSFYATVKMVYCFCALYGFHCGIVCALTLHVRVQYHSKIGIFHCLKMLTKSLQGLMHQMRFHISQMLFGKVQNKLLVFWLWWRSWNHCKVQPRPILGKMGGDHKSHDLSHPIVTIALNTRVTRFGERPWLLQKSYHNSHRFTSNSGMVTSYRQNSRQDAQLPTHRWAIRLVTCRLLPDDENGSHVATWRWKRIR